MLELYYPVKPLYMNQKFGSVAMLAYYKANGINITQHNGIDFATKHGQPIYATHDGMAYYEIDPGQGHGVVIRTNGQFDYEDGQAHFKTIYWHLCDPVKEPQFASPVLKATINSPIPVKAGDVIGYADSTGVSTGDHLHFGVKPVGKGEPANTWYNLEQNNGMYGAIDPNPYFNGLFAEDAQRHYFYNDMELGQTSNDIKELQKRLKMLGYFPATQECTGFYGQTTRESVFKFQLDHLVLSWWAKKVHKGRYCSTQTRAALNRT
jgi:hypothetical protein